MKRIFLSLLCCLPLSLLAQEVVTWTASYDKEGEQIFIQAKIKTGWHLYGQHIDPFAGPVPTSFAFKSSDDYQLIGQVHEPEAIRKYDENFEATLDFFEEAVTFTQHIEVNHPSILITTVTFMVCNNEMCLPPVDKKIEIELTN